MTAAPLSLPDAAHLLSRIDEATEIVRRAEIAEAEREAAEARERPEVAAELDRITREYAKVRDEFLLAVAAADNLAQQYGAVRMQLDSIYTHARRLGVEISEPSKPRLPLVVRVQTHAL